ncbi:MAG: tetraacyldisaccharide 4'-kinase [Planctomycetota bacterium]
MNGSGERHDADGRGRPERWLARPGGAAELFRLPAALFGALVFLRDRLYRHGVLPAVRLAAPVVSVGNLTAGGTGKTSLVRHLVRLLADRGRRPGVLSRGYRARGGEPSDEAAMLSALDPALLHVEDADRVAGGIRLVERGADVIVLDDGFQHRRLARDLDLVTVDATRPWGLPPPPGGGPAVRALLPRGLLREPATALARADAIVLTRADQVGERARAALEVELDELAPGRPILLAVHRPVRLRGSDGEARDPRTLAGLEVDLVSGIGNPDAFEATVLSLGARVRRHARFPDHHRFAPAELAGLGEGGRLVVTTAKDEARLAALSGPPALVRRAVLEVELAIERGGAVLDALLDALPLAAAARERRALHEGLHG